MSEMKARLCFCAGSAGVVLACLCLVFVPVFAQNSPGPEGKTPVKIAGNFDQVHVLPSGGPGPRMADGHPNLTGRYYPNRAGRMLQFAYRIDPSIMRQFDSKATPQEDPVFRPGAIAEYKQPTPYGSCPPGGTPTSITMQSSEHGPMELIQLPGVLWILTEFPESIRRIPTDGSPHPADPDVSFAGDSRGHWEGDTLVVDTIAVDERMRNIVVGDTKAWLHSDQQHIVERFARTSRNYLTYELMIEDPVVLAKPFHYVARTWSLAQNPNDVWTEYICTANEEPTHWDKMDPQYRQQYNSQTGQFGSGRGGQ
jgi:hypothetical protein